MTELWTARQCGEYIGLTSKKPEDGWRSYVYRLDAPEHVGFDPETGMQVWDAAAVRAWHAGRPGQGARTDLRKAT